MDERNGGLSSFVRRHREDLLIAVFLCSDVLFVSGWYRAFDRGAIPESTRAVLSTTTAAAASGLLAALGLQKYFVARLHDRVRKLLSTTCGTLVLCLLFAGAGAWLWLLSSHSHLLMFECDPKEASLVIVGSTMNAKCGESSWIADDSRLTAFAPDHAIISARPIVDYEDTSAGLVRVHLPAIAPWSCRIDKVQRELEVYTLCGPAPPAKSWTACSTAFLRIVGRNGVDARNARLIVRSKDPLSYGVAFRPRRDDCLLDMPVNAVKDPSSDRLSVGAACAEDHGDGSPEIDVGATFCVTDGSAPKPEDVMEFSVSDNARGGIHVIQCTRTGT